MAARGGRNRCSPAAGRLHSRADAVAITLVQPGRRHHQRVALLRRHCNGCLWVASLNCRCRRPPKAPRLRDEADQQQTTVQLANRCLTAACRLLCCCSLLSWPVSED
jgi:hypothetical protein